MRESESCSTSPILLVKNREGVFRMCVDYGEVNEHTITERYALPLIEDQFERLGSGCCST